MGYVRLGGTGGLLVVASVALVVPVGCGGEDQEKSEHGGLNRPGASTRVDDGEHVSGGAKATESRSGAARGAERPWEATNYRDAGQDMSMGAPQPVDGGSRSGDQEAAPAGMRADAAVQPGDAGMSRRPRDAATVPQSMVDRCGQELGTFDAAFVVDVDTIAFDIPQATALTSPIIWPTEVRAGRHAWMQWPDCVGVCRVNPASYLELVFGRSDTSATVLRGTAYGLGLDGTGVNGYAPAPYEDLLDIQGELEGKAPGRRTLLAPMVMPNDRLELQLTAMAQRSATASAWASFTGWRPGLDTDGYWLDDDVGGAFIARGLELGVPVFLIFKGMPWMGLSSTFTDPRDVGPAAVRHPDAHLVVMQAAFEHGLEGGETTAPVDADTDLGWGAGVGQWPEGPYDEVDPALQAQYPLDRGVNSLIKSLRDTGVGPNENVYVALGGVWAELIARPTEAAHVLGKLLLHIGEDNVLWGTQSMYYGGPAPQIEAFRAFKIPEALRTRYGYPELTLSRKAKILGLNAARLLCLRPQAG